MKVRISNLPDNQEKEHIRELLKKYGKIKGLRIVTDRYTAFNLIIVFVEFLDEQKGLLAIKELNELVINGIQIEVKLIMNQ